MKPPRKPGSGIAARGYRVTARVASIEEEYGMSFPEVIAAYAADGCNRALVSGILEYPDPTSFYNCLAGLKRAGITFAWPCPYATRAVPQTVPTPEQADQRRANLALGEPARIAYWEANRRVTPAMAEQIVELRNQQTPWASIAVRLNIHLTTLTNARKRLGISNRPLKGIHPWQRA